MAKAGADSNGASANSPLAPNSSASRRVVSIVSSAMKRSLLPKSFKTHCQDRQFTLD
jgi:hypothetical protein